MSARQKNITRIWIFRTVLIAITITSAVLCYWSYGLAGIGSGYYAKTLCSGVFVSKQSPEAVKREDILADMDPVLQLFNATLDIKNQTVTASIFRLAKRKAVYRKGLGCTLVIDKSEKALRKERAELHISKNAFKSQKLWPDGEIVNLTITDPAINQNHLKKAVAEAFAEPDQVNLRRTRAVVVVHKGHIVAEQYSSGISPNTALLGWSMTKTVINTLSGILIRENKLSLDARNLLPAWSKNKDPRSAISVDDLLRMSSGLEFGEEYDAGLSDVRVMLFGQEDMAGFAADKPLTSAPGSHWYYSSGTTNILVEVLKNAFGGTWTEFMAFPHEALFQPLGMSTALIEPDAAGNFAGSSYMYASARDWARLGLLYLQNGIWNGKTILPEGWVDYSRTPSKGEARYGAHLWVKLAKKHLSGSAPGPKIPDDAYFMLGHDGQIIAIIPSKELVVVRLGLSRNGAWKHGPFLLSVLSAFKSEKDIK